MSQSPPQLPAAGDADAIQDVGWPARRLKRWPIAPDWTPQPVAKRISTLGYQKVVGSVRALFTDAALADTLLGLQDYCFQQGGTSNANPRDRVFFFDALTHDLVFFQGDKGHPILEDLPLDPKIYDALPHMRASLFDLYRVDKRGLAGGATVTSLLRGVELETSVRPLKGPKRGEVILGRSVQIGRGALIDEPVLSVDPAWIGLIQKRFEEELAACGKRHEGLSPHSLLKVAGYHLYELVAAHALRDELARLLGDDPGLRPVIARFRLRRARDAPDLEQLDGAKVAERDSTGRATTVTVDLAPEAVVHRSIREALLSVEGRELVAVVFVERGADALLARLEALLPAGTHVRREAMTLDGTYRALRHVLSR